MKTKYFSDFRKRAGERGLPKDFNTWVKYEKQGLIKFKKLPSGWRYFRDMYEIDEMLDKFEKELNA